MKIEINKKDYNVLLKHIAIGNWIYGIMSDTVSSKYKKESEQGDELIHKILEYCDDKKIKENFEGKNIFSDEFTDKIYDDIHQYENFVIEDATGIDIEEIDSKLDEDFDKGLFNEILEEEMSNNPLFNKKLRN